MCFSHPRSARFGLMLSLIPARSFDAVLSTLASGGFSETPSFGTSVEDEGVVKGKAPKKKVGLSSPLGSL